MPIRRMRTQVTDHAAATMDWIDECSIAMVEMDDGDHVATSMIHVAGARNGRAFDVYVSHEGLTITDALEAFDVDRYDLVPSSTVDAALAAIEAYGHVEDVQFEMHPPGEDSKALLTAPGIGSISIRLEDGIDVSRELRRIARERRLDTEGHTLSGLGAKTLALAARSIGELDRIVDTVFRGGSGSYRGVRTRVSSQGVITSAYKHGGVEMRSDGIEIANLPETVRVAILGKQRRRLGEVVEIPGFDHMDIVGIGRNAASARSQGGQWVRLDVRDVDGAKFPQMEIEEGRSVAHEMFRKRNP